MTKIKSKRFNVSVRLVIEIGVDVDADSIVEAAQKAATWKITDIVDFKKNGWDHSDSETPEVRGVFATE